MIDFDKDFEKYLVNWYKKYESDFETVEDAEDASADVYGQWANTPIKKLGSLSPMQYFDSITNEKELITMLKESCDEKNSPCSLLLDRIVAVKECATLLKDIIVGGSNTNIIMTAINLIGDMQVAKPLELYVKIMMDKSYDQEVRELCVEMLSDSAKDSAELLFDKIDIADIEQKFMITEILINAPKDERTYNLLMNLFADCDDVPLIASYIGKYGDERSTEILFKRLEESNYLEYIEIKNAIEQMGGVVEDTRDFTNDEYYKALKNIK